MKNMENPLTHVSKNRIPTDGDELCPSCLMPRAAMATECTHCGIIFSQYKKWAKEKRTKLTISGLYHLSAADIDALENAWEQVEAVYLDQDRHERFIHMCQRLKSLPFAAYKYNARLHMFSDDDIARFQLGRVVTLAETWFRP